MLESHIKPKPLWLKLIPFSSEYLAHAIYPYIYVPEHVYDNLNSSNPNPKYIAVLLHEETHLRRQKKMGWIKWGLKYIFSPKFRFNEELEANKVAFRYLKKKKMEVDIKRKAKYLSGPLYLWPVTYKTALKRLEHIWNEI